MTTGTERTLTKPRYSVDQKSRDLAEYFLGEDRKEAVYRDLAQQIQDCVEGFCSALERAEVAAQEEALREAERKERAKRRSVFLHAVVADLSKTMQCNCDLDNWEPERSTGHSHVCRIHKAAIARPMP
jgi:hypothetical protein